MVQRYVLVSLDIGNCSREFHDSVVGACAETLPLERVVHEILAPGAQPGVLLYFVSQQKVIQFRLAIKLCALCSDDPRPDRRARYPGFARISLNPLRLSGHFNMDIDAVKQWTGNPLSIALDSFESTRATSRGIAMVAAGTWVHRSNQLETCRNIYRACSA